LDLNVRDEAFDHSSFAKNHDRPLKQATSRFFFASILAQARNLQVLSNDRFTVA
jgi:hypothetical protein